MNKRSRNSAMAGAMVASALMSFALFCHNIVAGDPIAMLLAAVGTVMCGVASGFSLYDAIRSDA